MTKAITSQSNILNEDLNHVMVRTADLWSEIRNQRIFFTGGTGFIGTWLLESFARANDSLGLNATALVLTRNQSAFKIKVPHLANYPSIKFLDGDVLSFEFPSENFSHIIHAATETSHDLISEDTLKAFDIIVSGTRRILEFARKANTKKILFTSSGVVYGKQLPHIAHIPEHYQGAPALSDPYIAYGEGKRVAELLCLMYARKYRFEVKFARCFAFVGPYMPLDQHFAIGNFIRDALQGGPIRVNGDGTPYRSYMYAADLAIWLWTILFRGESCRPYNVGSDVAMQIKDVANYVASEVPSGTEVVVKKAPGTSCPTERYVPDVSRARQELGLTVEISLLESIRRTIRWNTGI